MVNYRQFKEVQVSNRSEQAQLRMDNASFDVLSVIHYTPRCEAGTRIYKHSPPAKSLMVD